MSFGKRAALGFNWDRLGGWASMACAVHCCLAPLIFLVLPSVAKVWTHPGSHALMALGVVPLALTTLLMGYRRHKDRLVLVSASSGILLILAGSILPYLPKGTSHSAHEGAVSGVECCPTIVVDALGEASLHFSPAVIVTLLGSLALVIAHFSNRRRCAQCI
jgi:hypothetical protein